MRTAYALVGLILGIVVDEALRRHMQRRSLSSNEAEFSGSARNASKGRQRNLGRAGAFAAQDYYDH